jgi:hypothetical protein
MHWKVKNWRRATTLETNRSGEFSLAQAVMIDALCLLQAKSIHAKKLNKKQQEVVAWMQSDDVSWGYSFVNLCYHFQWEPSYARKLLLQGINPFTEKS